MRCANIEDRRSFPRLTPSLTRPALYSCVSLTKASDFSLRVVPHRFFAEGSDSRLTGSHYGSRTGARAALQTAPAKKKNAAVPVQVSVQKPRIDAGSEHGDGEDSKPVLCN
jgi:hypothetical protein